MSTFNTAPTLLNYAIDTVPDPLQASPDTGDPVMGVLTIIVSNGTRQAINLKSLTITIPVGPNAKDLTNNAGSIMASADPERLWAIAATTTAGVYIIQPVSGQPITITGTGVVFQFFNIPVNNIPGTFQVNIAEIASLTSTMPLVPANDTISLTKFPYGFFFSNLMPDMPAISNGKTVTLTWQGSTQAKYFMMYNDQTVDVSNVRKWESPALSRDTSFLLKAVSVSNGETVERGLSTTVNVMNPDIVANTLIVEGSSALGGSLTAQASNNYVNGLQVNGYFQATANAAIGTLNVTGPVHLQDTLQANGGALFAGAVTINGNTYMGNVLTINSDIVAVKANFQGVNVSYGLNCKSLNCDSMLCNYGYIQNPVMGPLAAQNVSLGLWTFYQTPQGDLQGDYNGRPRIIVHPGLFTAEEGTAAMPVHEIWLDRDKSPVHKQEQ